jgi:putative oxidoreductase
MKVKALWVLKVLLCLVFLAAGGAKLVGHERMVQVFDMVGIGQWFRVATGVIEVGAALALLVPRLAGWSAAVLACTFIETP